MQSVSEILSQVGDRENKIVTFVQASVIRELDARGVLTNEESRAANLEILEAARRGNLIRTKDCVLDVGRTVGYYKLTGKMAQADMFTSKSRGLDPALRKFRDQGLYKGKVSDLARPRKNDGVVDLTARRI